MVFKESLYKLCSSVIVTYLTIQFCSKCGSEFENLVKKKSLLNRFVLSLVEEDPR